MTLAQIALLRKLIDAEREHYEARLRGDFSSRWIEVGHFVRIDPRTVQSLVDAGLVETTSENGLTTIARLV